MHMLASISLISLALFGSIAADSILSSLLRNNLNRYLKNPLFTKSFVRNSIWNGEFNDPGQLPQMMAAEPTHLNNFMSVQGQFGADSMLHDPYSGLNGQPPMRSNDMSKLMAAEFAPPDTFQHMSSQLSPQILPLPPNPKPIVPNFRNASLKTNRGDKHNSRHNSKSLVLNENNTNAYSTNKVKAHNNTHAHSVKQNEPRNRYMDEDNDPRHNSMAHYKEFEDTQDGRNSHNHNLYNQEKALNLKMEYGFKPLPTSQKNSLQPDEGDFATQEANLVFKTRPAEMEHAFYRPTEETPKQSASAEHNIYTSFEGSSNDLASGTDREKKSFAGEKDGTDLHVHQKYTSFPMETESSDMHKLAFAGTEAFKPDYDRQFNVNGGDGADHLYVDILQNYPNIKNFRQEGVGCSKEEGYCHYDSSYPKDYVSTVIAECASTISGMYVEMPDNLTDFEGYKSFIQPIDVFRSQVNRSLCDANRKYIRPSVAQDVFGSYYLILQSSLHIQQIPVEICSSAGSPCNVVGQCGPQVKCTQKYSVINLISIDGPSVEDTYPNNHHNHLYHHKLPTNVKCPQIKMFRLPTACVCELSAF